MTPIEAKLIAVESLVDALRETESRRADLLDRAGPLMRATRHEAGLTLREVAKSAGVSIPYLSEVERGMRPATVKVLSGLLRAMTDRAFALRAYFHDTETWRRAAERVQDSDPFEGLVERAEAELMRLCGEAP